MKQSEIGFHAVSSRRDFNLMVLGQIISVLGSALLRFALSLYVLDRTGRADLYAALYAASNAALLLSPVGGVAADRCSRRNLMVVFDFTSSAIIFLYFLYLTASGFSIWSTAVVMILLSVISSMYQPAVTASIPLLVEQDKLEQANGLVNGVQALSNVAAPIAGGLMYGILGVRPLVMISAAAFFGSAVLELFIRIPFTRRKSSLSLTGTFKSDLKEGFLYIRRTPLILKSMVLAALLNLILTPFFVVGGPVVLKVCLNSSDTLYGVGMGTINFATILGAFLIAAVASKMQMKTLYYWLFAIALLMLPLAASVAPPISGLGFYPPYLLFLSCTVPIAMAMTILSIFVVTKVQKETPNELLGKVMAVITAVSQCAAPIGQLLYGALFQKFHAALYLPALFVSAAMFSLSFGAKKLYAESKGELC